MSSGTVSTVTPVRTFLLDHERLLIVILLLVTGWFVSGRVEHVIAEHDNKNLQAITLKANTDLAAANTAAAQAAQSAAEAQAQQAQYKALVDKLQAQDAAYAQQVISLTTALTAQQKKDDALTDPALAQRWDALLSLQPNEVTPVASGLSVTDDAAHKTVDQLEQVPVLKSELSVSNERLQSAGTLLAASNGQVATLNTEVGNLNTEVSGLRLTLVDDTKKCTEQLKTQHDKDRKLARKEIIAAYIAGILTKVFFIK